MPAPPRLTDDVEPRRGLLPAKIILNGDSVESCVLQGHLGYFDGAHLFALLHAVPTAAQ